jgi:ZIP family zinc transporter
MWATMSVLGVSGGGSFAWGAFAASSLLLGALMAICFRFSLLWIGLIMAFGSGVLISAVAFELVEESYDLAGGGGGVVFGLMSGCLVFFVGNELIGHLGGDQRKDPTGEQSSGNALGIVLGSVLDGVPESTVIGLTLVRGGAIGVAYIAAVFLSNLPEGISATRGLVDSGWARGRVLGLWAVVVAVSALASLAGYALLESASPDTVAFVQTFAAGAILTMLATTMMPEAFDHGGDYVGIATTLGFATAFGLHVFG